MEQNVIQIGNSDGMIFTKKVKQKLGIKRGDKIVVSETQEGIEIKRADVPRKKGNGLIDAEFKKWLKQALVEDAEILDELAIR